jgi:hypothetical protein
MSEPLRDTIVPAQLNTRRGSVRLTGRPARRSEAMLELMDEVVDQEIDVNEMYNALAALLVSSHRKRQAEGATA